jgi:hypothetical protein
VEWGIESAESSPYSFFDIPGFRWFPIFEVGEPLRLPLAGLQLERGPIRNVRNTTLLVRRSYGVHDSGRWLDLKSSELATWKKREEDSGYGGEGINFVRFFLAGGFYLGGQMLGLDGISSERRAESGESGVTAFECDRGFAMRWRDRILR